MGNVTGSAQKETLSYKIGDFRVIRELGSGGFAKVYLAEDEKKNLFALKVFYSAEQSQSFENEFQTQKSLQHEGVVECFELFFDETARGTRQYCLVQEYCEAGDLLKHISKENAIPIDLMMKWFIFLIETLAFIHSKKIIHRDIKPENILITADSAVKFSDFGIATKKINAQTKIGTEYYVAPEVVSEQSYDAKVDIWSLGCVLYQCIIGDKSNVKFREAAKADFPLVKDESIKAILRKMLQVNHHQRPTAEELLLDPCVIGWKVALALPLTASQRPYAESSHTLAPMLSILINGSLPGRLQAIETLHRSTSLNIAEVRAILLTSGALLSLLEKAGETAADLERVLKCLEPFEGSELRQARCLEPLINYLEKRKSAQLVPLIIRVAKQDPGSRALISSDQRTFGICKSLINSYPDMTVLVRDPVQLIKLVEQLSGSQEKIDTAVKEYFISHTLPANKRSELLKLAMNSNMFSVLYHNIFDWNTVVNSALKKKICLDDLTENVRSQHAVFGCRSCDLNQAMDVLCIVCALHSHAQHELENKPSSVAQPREGCMGARAHSRQLHPLSNTLIPSPQKAPLETGYSNPAAATIQIDKDVICGTVERPISLQSSIAINKTAECFYFEVTAKTTGFTDSMSIGISRLHYSPEAFPGWEQLSIGYQSNGKLYLGDKERGKVFGYRYKAGDVIGCGVHPSGSVFFTLNGIFIGFCDSFNVFARSNQTYFPTIGMHNGPFKLEVNFGAKPFLFPFIFTDDLPKIDKWPASVAVLKELDVNLGALVTKLTHVTERQTIFQLILCINALVGQDLERRKIVAQAISKPQLLQYLDKHHSNTPMTCRIVENWFDIPNAGKPAEPRQQMPTAPIPSSKVPVPGQRNRGSDTILLPTEKITFFVTAEGKHGKYTVKLPRVGLTVAALKEAVADELDEPVEKIKALLYFVVRKNKREPEEVNITRSTLLELVNESDIKAVL